MISFLAGRRFGFVLIALASLTVMGVAHAQTTNSWIGRSGGKWERVNRWDDGLPSASQSAVIISNANSKTVTINARTARRFPSSLTISNLTVSAQRSVINTLIIDRIGPVALDVVNGLTVGSDPNTPFGAGGSALISINSTLIVDGLTGGQLEDDGTIIISGGSLITTNCSLQVAGDDTTSLLIISNAVAQARDVTITSGDEASGMIEVIGGTMTLSSSLTVGNGVEDSPGSLLVANGGRLVVTNDETDIGGALESSGDLTVTDATFLAADIVLGGERSDGELTINDGTVTLSGELDLGSGEQSSGSVSLNGGRLVVTNGATRIGVGSPSSASMEIFDGLFLARDVHVGAFQSDGTLVINGGSVTISEGITLGDCDDASTVGYASVDGGRLIVTNAAGSGFIDVQNGQLILGGGVAQVDKLVMTNSCSSLVHTGGTLIVGSVVLDPNAFGVTSVAQEGNNLLVTWLMGPGQTNALQAASVSSHHHHHTTNDFVDIFVVTNNTTPGVVTNYLDVGAATNVPARVYRAELFP